MTRYSAVTDYRHQNPAAAGVLLVNLGTPDAPTPAAVRRYLSEFLSDPRVIELHRALWWPVLHGVILRIRPQRSAHAYSKIWTDQGSPLLYISGRQLQSISRRLAADINGSVQVALGMRYGNPSIQGALEQLRRSNVQRLLIMPLYPQYSATTTGSVFDAVTALLRTWRWVPELRMVNQYHDDKGYIAALAESMREHWQVHARGDRLLFSFHGLPKKNFLAGDPYFCQCQKTARLTAEMLGLPDNSWLVSFQSRFGPMEWLKPYTDETLAAWGKQGVRSVDIICPGFAADCLETLEEIQIRYRDLYLASGGERFTYLPALNDRPAHIDALVELIKNNCQGWPEFAHSYNAEAEHAAAQRQQKRAAEMKPVI